MSNERQEARVRLTRLVSGGQTGVDRAALDAAAKNGLEMGGWCPRGRLAEDGRIDARYPLRETPTHEYDQRTAWNVRDSDATLILTEGEPTGGTAYTIEEARRLGKPHFIGDPASMQVDDVRDWVRRHKIRTLNVAGPRESEAGGIYSAAYAFMDELLGGG